MRGNTYFYYYFFLSDQPLLNAPVSSFTQRSMEVPKTPIGSTSMSSKQSYDDPLENNFLQLICILQKTNFPRANTFFLVSDVYHSLLVLGVSIDSVFYSLLR